MKSDSNLVAEYTAEQTAAKKRIYREGWAKREFKDLKTGKTYTHSYQEVNEELGTYHTLGGVVTEFGGWQWPPAIAGAKHVASKCMMMGGKWTYVDNHSGLRFFLVLKKIYRETLSECWTQFREESTVSAAAAATAAAAPAHTTPPSSTVGQAAKGSEQEQAPDTEEKQEKKPKKPKSKAKAKGKKTADEVDPDSEQKDSPAIAKEKKLVSEMNKLKAQVVKHMAVARNLEQQIHDNPAYLRLKNPGNLGRLEEAMAKLQGTMSPFHHEYLVVDARAMRDKVNGNTFITELESFRAVETLVATVAKEVKVLMSMHKQGAQ